MVFTRHMQAETEKKYAEVLQRAIEEALDEYNDAPREALNELLSGDIQAGRLEIARDDWSFNVTDFFETKLFVLLRENGVDDPENTREWIEFTGTCAERLTDRRSNAAYVETYRSAQDTLWGWIYDHI